MLEDEQEVNTELEVAIALVGDCTKLRTMLVGISGINYPLYHACLRHIGTMEAKINGEWGVMIAEHKQVLSDAAIAAQNNEITKGSPPERMIPAAATELPTVDVNDVPEGVPIRKICSNCETGFFTFEPTVTLCDECNPPTTTEGDAGEQSKQAENEAPKEESTVEKGAGAAPRTSTEVSGAQTTAGEGNTPSLADRLKAKKS